MIQLSIIIPVFNEINTIATLLKKIEKTAIKNNIKKEIIIVDDYSTDGTAAFLKELESSRKNKYTIIYNTKNTGKGMAIRTALKKATGDYIITQDADLEYDPEDYTALIECAIKNNAPVVYGSRLLHKGNKPASVLYFWGGRFITLITNLLYNTRLTDEPTGYKLFKREFIANIPINAKKFEFCPEITAKIAKRKIPIVEVPIRYYARTKKEGKKLSWKDGFMTIYTLLKYKFVD